MRPIWILLFMIMMVVVAAQTDEESRDERRAARRRERMRRRRQSRRGATTTTTTEAPAFTAQDDTTLVTVQSIDFEMLLEAARANRERNQGSSEDGSASETNDTFDPDVLLNRSSIEMDLLEDNLPPLTAQQWRARVRSKQMRIFMIQRQILEQLGLDETPNVTSLVPEEQDRLTAVFETFATPDNRRLLNEGYVERLDSYLTICDVSWAETDTWTTSTRMRLYFEPSREENVRITSALLSLYKKPNTEHRNSNVLHVEGVSGGDGAGSDILIDEGHIMVTVYKYLEPVQGNHDDRREERSLVISTTIRRDRVGWIQLNILEAVEQWYNDWDSNYGLIVTVENDDGDELQADSVFGQPDCTAEDSSSGTSTGDMTENEALNNATYRNLTSPHLDIITVDGRTPSRQKRYAPAVPTPASSCRRESSKFNMMEHGLAFIIAPQVVDTGYCVGECDAAAESEGLEGVRCGPTARAPLPIMYFVPQSDTARVTSIPDLIITECGCDTSHP